VNRLAANRNVVLIGMPGVGKSTVGVLLAKVLARVFVDTDLLLQRRCGERLQPFIDRHGLAAFLAAEERLLCSLRARRAVVATGGSAVYSERGMQHLAHNGLIVWLDLPLAVLRSRLSDLPTRGVVREPGQSLAQLHALRRPLYRRHARFTVPCAGLSHEQVVQAILARLQPEETPRP
jgi:shikimate kinase